MPSRPLLKKPVKPGPSTFLSALPTNNPIPKHSSLRKPPRQQHATQRRAIPDLSYKGLPIGQCDHDSEPVPPPVDELAEAVAFGGQAFADP
jgi:hypothetical protein